MSGASCVAVFVMTNQNLESGVKGDCSELLVPQQCHCTHHTGISVDLDSTYSPIHLSGRVFNACGI